MQLTLLEEIRRFLPCPTPEAWVQEASRQQELLLIDHANCEKKAASTALNLIYRYVDKFELLNKMSRLAREELRHFEQVLAIMNRRGIAYRQITASGYAGGLRALVRHQEPHRLVDTLIVGAFIEARSCERFACLAPILDTELQQFYLSLLKSEGRHYRDYLNLARGLADGDIAARIDCIGAREARLILEPDEDFRFHSGVPSAATVEEASGPGSFQAQSGRRN